MNNLITLAVELAGMLLILGCVFVYIKIRDAVEWREQKKWEAENGFIYENGWYNKAFWMLVDGKPEPIGDLCHMLANPEGAAK